LSDCVLAAVALTNNCSIYTTDAHFSRIPHVKLYRSERH
jgi:predicted nucleic acid-binding protein